MDRFDKFTDRARKVLTLAQDEAQRFNHNYIGTEHLLLGLVREGEGVAARVLENMNVELPKVRTAVEFIIGRGDRPVVGEVGLTPRAKRVIELAIDEARRLGHNYIGTEHLLLGLVREGEGIAAGVLESLGVNLDKVRHEVIRVLSQSSATGAPASETKRSSKTPTVDQLGINLTDAARAGKLDPVIGREKEIERVVQILSRRRKNNPALIGEPGVGKTAIAEGLAHRIVSGDIPEIARGQARPDARHRLARRRHQVPRRVRGAPQEDHRGAAQHERRDPLHRRAAHARRRRCRRRRDRRGQHPEAAARARRAPVHRRDDPRRVPQVHREGRRPRAPLPAGDDRGAHARADRRHPLRHPRGLRAAPPGARSPDEAAQGRGRPLDPLHHRPPPAGQGHRPHRRGASRVRLRHGSAPESLKLAQKELERITQGEGVGGQRPGLRARAGAARRRVRGARPGRPAAQRLEGRDGRGDA